MIENNLKELGTMLVKAGNTIERQKKEIERLRREKTNPLQTLFRKQNKIRNPKTNYQINV